MGNMRDKKNIGLDEIKELYKFLQGEDPEGFNIKAMPNLSPDQAFSVIYYLQEGLMILPNHYEKCQVPECDTLFNSEQEGCLALFCDGCGCQHPGGYDPQDEDCDGCCECPLVCGACETCKEQGKENCSCINNPVPIADI